MLLTLCLALTISTSLPQSSLVLGQETNATCMPEYSWMSNSKGQSPCLVSSYLLTPCLSGTVLPGRHYSIAHNTTADNCTCNTVFYSMLFACDVCQLGPTADVIPWSLYSQGCSVPLGISLYPEAIPSTTEVPSWAQLDVTVNDTFNAMAAEALALGNNSSSMPAASSSGQPRSSSRSTGLITASATGTQRPSSGNGEGDIPNSSKKSSPVGAIVGGVVGGVIGVTAISATILWARRRRNVTRSSPAGSVDQTTSKGEQWGEEAAEAEAFPPPLVPGLNLKLYDPDDPSTYPNYTPLAEAALSHATTSPPQADTMSTAQQSVLPHLDPYNHQLDPSAAAVANAAYKGVPEL
ncbi:hypothetical protein OH77DRAFT_760679 [Trametes cingulata]|nr:hypothetical protein OH77DRAFT_760679 [Trametes cingulata]